VQDAVTQFGGVAARADDRDAAWVEKGVQWVCQSLPPGICGILCVADMIPRRPVLSNWVLLRLVDLDPSSIIPARSREVGAGFLRSRRPLDCTLNCSRAQALLRTPLPGVDEVLASLTPRQDALQ